MGEKPPQSDGVRTWSENLDRLGEEFTDLLARRRDAENLILRVMWSAAGLLSIAIAAVFAITWWTSSTPPGGVSGPGVFGLLNPGGGGPSVPPLPSLPAGIQPTPASPPAPRSTPAPVQASNGPAAPVVIVATPVAAVIPPSPAPAPAGVTGLVGSLLQNVENLAGNLLGG